MPSSDALIREFPPVDLPTTTRMRAPALLHEIGRNDYCASLMFPVFLGLPWNLGQEPCARGTRLLTAFK